MPNAAGILFIDQGRGLMLKRAPTADDYPNTWGLPGGGIEDGETPEQAAVREAQEEIGVSVNPADLLRIADDGHFVTYIAPWPEDATVALNDEHIGHQWVAAHEADSVPDLHPGLAATLARPSTPRLFQMGQTETDVMRMMADGLLPSPQKFANMWLYALRITGTGVAVRHFDDAPPEVTYRPPEFYLSDEFLARCNGLPVIVLHPEEKPMLDSEEFARRIVGAMALPYIQGDEVWGIARIYDAAIGEGLQVSQLSTSPNVVFLDPRVNSTIALDDGTPLLIEGNPSLVDHLAICRQGVWDKGGEPSGVKSENLGELEMPTEKETEVKKDGDCVTPEVKKDADNEAPAWAKALSDGIAGLTSRMDALESSSKKDADGPAEAETEAEREEREKSEREAKAKADADEALKGKLGDLEETVKPLSDEDADAMADAQHRADSLANALGMSAAATRPMMGEKPLAYRRRMARKFQGHSAAYKDADLSTVTDTAVFSAAEATIYTDAQAHAQAAPDVPAGKLREVKRQDATGRVITEFLGSPDACWGAFKQPARRVGGFAK